MSRPTAQDRRRDYLAIGADIVLNFSADESRSATVDALANVRIADVADRSGVTKGALYHVWPSQEAYRRDLLERLLDQSRQAGVRELLHMLDQAQRRDEPPHELMHRHADFVFDALKNDAAFYARFSFFVYATNPEVSELLAAGDDGIIEDFSPYTQMYLATLGRRLREPFTAGMLLTSVNALFQGLCLRYRTSPSLVETPEGEPSMYATGIDALMLHFSEPIDEQSTQTPSS